jgi:hypothetical protein
MHRTLCLLIVLVSGAAWPDEATDTDRAAIARLPPLAGAWAGEGWMRGGPSEPERFVGEERVELRLEGRALLIEGKHWMPDRSRLVHNALGIVTYDAASGQYRFRTHVAGQPPGDFRAYLDGGAFIWEMDAPRGRTRFTIRVVNDEWREIGEIELDGRWRQFFEMKLKRLAHAER